MPLLVLILGTFILEVKIEKIDCSQLGRNSSGVRQASGETALGYYPPWPLSQTVLAGQDQDEDEDKDKENSKGYLYKGSPMDSMDIYQCQFLPLL